MEKVCKDLGCPGITTLYHQSKLVIYRIPSLTQVEYANLVDHVAS